MSQFSNILIFTDGACSGNPGPGGWGAIVATPAGHVTELGGKRADTTNNRMEMLAVIEALKITRSSTDDIDVYTDSTYVIRGITQWIWGWKKRGWINAEGQEVANRDLWLELDRAAQACSGKINWLYSRGHVGTPGNERCDEIAVHFSKGQWVELYDGPLIKYSIAIFDLPENAELPPMREKQEKKAAFSYLSYVHGEVYRHPDWPSCERRVKGQSGAKFKKALSSSNEAEILQSWGLSSSVPIKE